MSLWVEPYHKDHEPGYFSLLSLKNVFATSAHCWPYCRASVHYPCSKLGFIFKNTTHLFDVLRPAI